MAAPSSLPFHTSYIKFQSSQSFLAWFHVVANYVLFYLLRNALNCICQSIKIFHFQVLLLILHILFQSFLLLFFTCNNVFSFENVVGFLSVFSPASISLELLSSGCFSFPLAHQWLNVQDGIVGKCMPFWKRHEEDRAPETKGWIPLAHSLRHEKAR